MNLVVETVLGSEACGKGESGHDQDPLSGLRGGQGKKGIRREYLLLKSWQVQSL
jgi:hypothetical protein